MDFIFNGKTYSIDLSGASPSGEITGKVNDIPISLSASKISESCLLLVSDNQIRRAYVASSGDKVFVHLGGQVITLIKITEDRKSYSKDALEFGAKDQVSTPMPGKVVKILVEVGERIALKQPLVIVESMKMENELKSPSNGIVKSIHFAPGDLVNTGQPIIMIEPQE
jgi:acetyl/propionyl-CoA carboxylase alpha subunit